ncbi:MAG: MBL fold metallo-hydrolase [Pyrodictiaceae archaeon]
MRDEAKCARVLLEEYGVTLIWFDSLGAKSSSIYHISGIIVDPGAAAMQPSYPLPHEEKERLRREAIRRIEEFAYKANVIIITHYHYDHYARPWDPDVIDPAKMYLDGKIIIAKNPNYYINESQWKRSREFIESLARLAGLEAASIYEEPKNIDIHDPLDNLPYALSKDFGDYSRRRIELLEKGKKWFNKLSRLWHSSRWVKNRLKIGSSTIILGDRGFYETGGVRIRLLGSWFHGVEYDRTGWVTPVLIEWMNKKILYTSDLMGPIIEDYAYKIIEEKPDIIIADGPPTYLYPYMLNRINLKRAIENMELIVLSNPDLVIYDHHLLREKKWRERIAPLLETARRHGVPLLTAAECMGRKPLIDRL